MTEPTGGAGDESPDWALEETIGADSQGSGAGAQVSVGDAAVRALSFEERYERHRELGRGGMGEVHACRDRIIGREVALKALLSSRRDRLDAQARFLREARVQGQLEHPSVVPVYDLGVSPDGSVYFTMKRVRGRTLEELIATRRAGEPDAPTLQQLLIAFGSVCLAVELAHRRGVVHRDLKPSNVMLGDYGEVYVLDWGLAKLVRETEEPQDAAPAIDSMEPSDSSGSTREGSLLGTPGYMSPEQARGLEVGPPSDVYALGAILFELLALEPLHRGETVQALLASTVASEAAQPSARRPDLSIPPELDAICGRAVATDLDARWPSARALHDAVQRYLEGDRDLALRRRLAAEHVAAAREAAGRPERRREALAEVGRAIALTPEDDDAIGMLRELLLTPPDRVPDEVVRELDDTRAQQYRVASWQTLMSYGLITLVTAGLAAFEVRNTAVLVGIVGLSAVTALVGLQAALSATVTRLHAWITFVTATASMVLMCWIASPLVLAPAMMTASAMAFSLTPIARDRYAMVALTAVAWLVPLALHWTGAVPPFFELAADGSIVVYPRVVALDSDAAAIVCVVAHVMCIIMPGIVAGGIRDSLHVEQIRSRIQAWNIRQMLPEKARPAGT